MVARAGTSVLGRGPAASKNYGIAEGVSIGGYGEIWYENFADPSGEGEAGGKPDQADALRAIVYVGYSFNDRYLLNPEIELQHGSTGQAGSVSPAFVYLDYRCS